LEYLIHHGLEGGWTIGETKVHHQQLKEALIGVEGCFPLVALLDTDIVVSPVYVIACTLEVMDSVVDQCDGIAVLVHDGVESAVVLDES
jgi:hypothetical protein